MPKTGLYSKTQITLGKTHVFGNHMTKYFRRDLNQETSFKNQYQSWTQVHR